MPPTQLQQLTRDQVAAHNKPGVDCWIIIDSVVYDVTKFAQFHPGGSVVFDDVAGTDCTDLFYSLHRQDVLAKPSAERLKVATVADEAPLIRPWSDTPSAVPYGEPSWLVPDFASPYFGESHQHLQRAFRRYVADRLVAVAQEYDPLGKRPPPELMREMGALGINAMRLGPGAHLAGRKLFADIQPDEFTYLHELVMNQELFRLGASPPFPPPAL